MKFTAAVGAALVITITILVVIANFTHEVTAQNKVRVAFFPNINHIVPIVGMENGIFSKNLEGTEIETRLFDSGPQVIESMFANSVDIAYVGPGPAINGFLQSKNNEIQIISGAASNGVSFVVNPESQIKTAEDLDGKRIAAPLIGNTQDISLRNYLYENGLRPADKGGSVYVFNLENPEIYTLFAKGDIDGAWVPEPWATRLVLELGGVRLFNEEDLWPQKQFASVVLVARNDYIKNHPEIVSKWLDAHTYTVNWINQNPDQSKVIFNQFLKNTLGKSLKDEIINEAFSHIQITTDPSVDSIYIFAERANSVGYLGRHGYNLDGIFHDTNLVKALLENET